MGIITILPIFTKKLLKNIGLDIKNWQFLVVSFAAIFVYQYLEFWGTSSIVLLPFIPFLMGACDGDDGDDDADDSDPDDDGPDSNCADEEGGCNCACNCESDCLSSTPFLYTWDGANYKIENDFLFGKPKNTFSDFEEGKHVYESSSIEGDLYRIKNKFEKKDNKINFQIKEIEPEESFIDYLSLLHVRYPKNSELIVDSKHGQFFVFEKEAIETNEGIKQQDVFDEKNVSISSKLGSTFTALKGGGTNKVYEMEAGDSIEIKGLVKDKTKQLFLLLGSHYRDWTLGEIFNDTISDASQFSKSSIKSPLNLWQRTPHGFIKGVGLVLVFSVVWTIGFVGNFLKSRPSGDTTSISKKKEEENDFKKLISSFGVKKTHADTPSDSSCSLVIRYWDGNEFQEVDIVQTRYYQSDVEAITVPSEAIQPNGEVRIQVQATKKHNVASVTLMAPQKLLSFKKENLEVTKAFHHRTKKDYARVLNSKNSKQYLHTIPADVVDIEFEKSQVKNDDSSMQETYLIKADGFYTPASEETQQSIGNWVERLDPETRGWLKNMYSLNNYHKGDRTTILS